MDETYKKRKQTIRVVITEFVMVVSVVMIVALLMFIVMGYSLKNSGDEWGIERSGLVQLVSTPSGASIAIDGEGIFQRTETSRMLAEGEHEVELSREGYDTWSKKIDVRPGIFLRIKYPRLFKTERQSEEAETFKDLEWIRFAKNRNSLLYSLKDEKKWHFVSLRNDVLTETEINTEECFTGTLEKLTWLGNGEKVLIRVANEEAKEWLMIDLRTPSKSVNLTKEFGMDFTEIRPLNDAADKLWVVENGNLRQLYVSNKEASGVLANKIISFANNKSEVVYLAKTDGGARAIYTYRDGDSEAVQVKKIDDAEATVRVAVEEYLGDTYLSYVINNKFTGYKADEFPAGGQEFQMEKYLELELEITPANFQASDNGQFVIIADGRNLAVMDAETEKVYQYTLENDRYFWLDDYLIGVVDGGELVVRDFDGTNRRVLTKASGDYPAIIALNGKWLYYFTVSDEQVNLNREEL